MLFECLSGHAGAGDRAVLTVPAWVAALLIFLPNRAALSSIRPAMTRSLDYHRQWEATGAEAGEWASDVLPGPEILSPAGLQPTTLTHSRQSGNTRSIQ